jgi:hypothetical protein
MRDLLLFALPWAFIAAAVVVGNFVPSLGELAIGLWLAGIVGQAWLVVDRLKQDRTPGQTTYIGP